MTNIQILEKVIKTIPYPDQIENIDLNNQGSIRFDWRGIRFRVSDSFMVEEVNGGMLSGSVSAILFQHLLRD